MYCLIFISNYSNIDGITGFSEEGSQSVFTFMKSAVDMAKSGDGQVTVLLSCEIKSFSNRMFYR